METQGEATGTQPWFGSATRLYKRGQDSRGLSVNEEGVMLGSDCRLIRRTALGYEAADARELAGLLKSVLIGTWSPGELTDYLGHMVKALNSGDLFRARSILSNRRAHYAAVGAPQRGRLVCSSSIPPSLATTEADGLRKARAQLQMTSSNSSRTRKLTIC
jgi:hypothetical protein